MTTITFDTLKFVQTLEQAGFDEKQAKGISTAFKEASGEANLATKGDIEDMEHHMQVEFMRVDSEMKLHRWMLTALLAINTAILLKLLF
ncbi:MAG: Protein of unknown function (DUF1640) [Candidatus Kentron sp. G]|nr:MAG: Protein of unknown function (DUF1640) [Candidatus Kentron sp. G]VFM99427.1 MAG: Protein of unknown function (DUF1640) [Candidatus Kentron sp. G]VFN00257.1 MAG: Protein of unknown function (DUF1640) [Candidatus Kentron sp. G]